MTKVLNVYLVMKISGTEVLSMTAWVLWEQSIHLGDKVMADNKLWEIHTIYTGSIKEEVEAMYPGINFYKVIKNGT